MELIYELHIIGYLAYVAILLLLLLGWSLQKLFYAPDKNV